jgi:hypothetical protein
MKILKIAFSYLRNEAHYQFLLLVTKLFGVYPNVANIVTNLLLKFYELTALEGQLVDAVRASGYTQELAEADQRVDRDIVGITAVVNSGLHHFDANFVKAAKALEILLKSFRGSIEKKSYEEESAAVKILVTDLQTTYAPQVTILSLETWVTELSEAQVDFERLFILRNTESADRPQQRLKDVKLEVEGIYRQMIETIDAYSLINGSEECAKFVGELNREITYFNEHSHRHAAKDIKNVGVSSIPNQAATGKEITPIPIVYFEDTELVFARDFNPTYKNNINPGTATIILHGKGMYKGQRELTFNIYKTAE